MIRKLSWIFLLLLAVSLWATEGEEAENQTPVVSNPIAKQLGVDGGVKAAAGERISWEKDGSEMVLIPAGSFEMGDHHDNMGNALPVHTVELNAFYMDVHEVTVGQFLAFVNQSGYNYGGNWNDIVKNSLGDGYPMSYVSWNDVTAYAKWAGKRLPTEVEWEYAARGGLVGKRYPWGDDQSLARDYANYGGTGGKDEWDESTAPVGSFSPNGYGLYDIAGNVWEWCADWYSENYYSSSSAKNPPGPGTGSFRVLRGGNWYHGTTSLRVANRLNISPLNRHNTFGFRCVSGSNFTPGLSEEGGFTSGEATPLPPANNQGVIEWEKDNSQMALIPAGSFEMGDHHDNMSRALPVHTVTLDAFYMDVHEVTVGQFLAFVDQSGYNYGGNWNDVVKNSLGDRYPMSYVSWNDAVAYAEWAGKRLPTEAEWEYAARGGLVGERYLWGNEAPTAEKANYNVGKTTAVGSFEANGYGLYDMAGNVYEWCADWYGEDYYSKSPAKNPRGPATGSRRVLRSGLWYDNSYYLRVAVRNYYLPASRTLDSGFRCVSGSNFTPAPSEEGGFTSGDTASSTMGN